MLVRCLLPMCPHTSFLVCFSSPFWWILLKLFQRSPLAASAWFCPPSSFWLASLFLLCIFLANISGLHFSLFSFLIRMFCRHQPYFHLLLIPFLRKNMKIIIIYSLFSHKKGLHHLPADKLDLSREWRGQRHLHCLQTGDWLHTYFMIVFFNAVFNTNDRHIHGLQTGDWLHTYVMVVFFNAF